MNRVCWIVSVAWAVLASLPATAAAQLAGEPGAWRETLLRRFSAGPAAAVTQCLRDFPAQRLQLAAIADWVEQDRLDGPGGLRVEVVATLLDRLGPAGTELRARLRQLQGTRAAPHDRRWAELYLDACAQRRQARLTPHRDKLARVIFTKHYDMGGSHYAYTEGLSDAQNERHFKPGASLCLLELDGLFGTIRTLIDDRDGVLRDPDVSYDGKRVLFSWKKSHTDDYHLYELDVATRKVRQLTFGAGFADYEGAYLPSGDLVFNSTRCVQTVPCWWTEVSNLFTCAGDGRYLRRLSYDQVHTNYPTVTGDGRVSYTRWEYNDRGQIFVQGLFQMNPDGTAQRELYGNSSWFPTALLHARHIPGTGKYVAILSGHHTRQQGWLGLVDPSRGRQENSGVQLIAPVRKTEAVRIDRYGQNGDQFQYPYPLSESAFLVTCRPAPSSLSPKGEKGKAEGARHFALYFITASGERELLACDAKISCNQPVPLAARPVPPARASQVDYRQQTGTFYLHDVYAGDGLQGVPRGTVRRLRVVALDYRAAGVGRNSNHGPAGGALVSTPISLQGSWDVKVVLGTVPVQADGSASFTVPARTPLYFQALDSKGHAIQTMRSWATLQPGEVQSCVGCHDQQNTTAPTRRPSLAARAGPQELTPWYGPPRGFSFVREVQPVLDRHCISCHHVEAGPGKQAGSAGAGILPAFSLKGTQRLDPQALRKWSDAYRALADRKFTNWVNVQSEPPVLPPYHAGAAKSKLIRILEDGHHGVKLAAEEMDRLVTWIDLLVPYCGDYREGLDGANLARYEHFLRKRQRWQAEEAANIAAYLRDRCPPALSASEPKKPPAR